MHTRKLSPGHHEVNVAMLSCRCVNIFLRRDQSAAVFFLPDNVSLDEAQQRAHHYVPGCLISARRGCTLVYFDGIDLNEEEAKHMLTSLANDLSHGKAPAATLSYGNRLYSLCPDGSVKVSEGANNSGIISAKLVARQPLEQQTAASKPHDSTGSAPVHLQQTSSQQLQVELLNVAVGDKLRVHVRNHSRIWPVPVTLAGQELQHGMITTICYCVPSEIADIEYVEWVAASGLTSSRIPVTNMTAR